MQEDSELTLVTLETAGRLDKELASQLPEWSRTKLRELIERGGVRVDGKPLKPSSEVRPGLVVEIIEMGRPTSFDLTPVAMDLDIPYEDDHLLVVQKPRGLPTHPATSYTGPTLVHGLLAQSSLSQGSESYRPGIVHRLDKETTGLLVVAKTDFAHAQLAEQMATRTAGRQYVALVYGDLDQDLFRIEAPIARNPRNRLKMCCHPDGRFAATQIRKMRRLDAGTLVACKLETGRTHQIRVHLEAVGHPVLGDDLYASGDAAKGVLQLHAAHLAFVHPVTKEAMAFYSQPPADFLAHEFVSESLFPSA